MPEVPIYDMLPPVGTEVRDGAVLHRQVPPHRWCVTKSDLADLRCSVEELVAKGIITPTDRDPFDPNDQVIGPCIHTITHQLIKPVTDKAGKVSWALMLHPEGLECDLFVTHCWQEGIYEFIDKVLNSWPSKARHAYCCMLSNPQNLDIGDLICCPKESPFARALHTSSYMLVVPNHACSIYSRIWCAYEAFLAYSEAYSEPKLIYTAQSPVPDLYQHVAKVALIAVPAFSVSALICAQFPMPDLQGDAYSQSIWYVIGLCLATLAFVCLMAAGLIMPGHTSWVLLCISASCSSANLGIQVRQVWVGGHTEWALLADTFLSVGMCAAACVGEAVRLCRVQSVEESRQLSQGYTGKLRDAQASVQADRDTILEALASSGHEQQVDEAVGALLDAGMSTPILRAASAKAGRMKLAGFLDWSTILVAVVAWFYLSLTQLGSAVERNRDLVKAGRCGFSTSPEPHCTDVYQQPYVWISVFGFFEAQAWLLLFLLLSTECRVFAASALVRILAIWGSVCMVVGVIVVQVQPRDNAVGQVVVHLVLGPLVMALGAAGPAQVADVPVFGPWLVQKLMQRFSMKDLCHCMPKVHPSGEKDHLDREEPPPA